jgi:succinylglutamate desuccinylase
MGVPDLMATLKPKQRVLASKLKLSSKGRESEYSASRQLAQQIGSLEVGEAVTYAPPQGTHFYVFRNRMSSYLQHAKRLLATPEKQFRVRTVDGDTEIAVVRIADKNGDTI